MNRFVRAFLFVCLFCLFVCLLLLLLFFWGEGVENACGKVVLVVMIRIRGVCLHAGGPEDIVTGVVSRAAALD